MTEAKCMYRPDFALFDHIMETNNLKNDARLFEFFDKKISKPDISKYRHRKKKMGSQHILVIHEKLGMPVAEIRDFLAKR
jgi:hypothetical protein